MFLSHVEKSRLFAIPQPLRTKSCDTWQASRRALSFLLALRAAHRLKSSTCPVAGLVVAIACIVLLSGRAEAMAWPASRVVARPPDPAVGRCRNHRSWRARWRLRQLLLRNAATSCALPDWPMGLHSRARHVRAEPCPARTWREIPLFRFRLADDDPMEPTLRPQVGEMSPNFEPTTTSTSRWRTNGGQISCELSVRISDISLDTAQNAHPKTAWVEMPSIVAEVTAFAASGHLSGERITRPRRAGEVASAQQLSSCLYPPPM